MSKDVVPTDDLFIDGKVVLIPPEEIRVEDDDPTEPVQIYRF